MRQKAWKLAEFSKCMRPCDGTSAVPGTKCSPFLERHSGSDFEAGQTYFAALTLAQRACCATRIFFLVAALTLRFLAGLAVGEVEPKMEASSFSKRVIFSLRAAACLSCVGVNDNRLMLMGL